MPLAFASTSSRAGLPATSSVAVTSFCSTSAISSAPSGCKPSKTPSARSSRKRASCGRRSVGSRSLSSSASGCSHPDGFEALSFQSERPFAAQRFQDFLERLPDNVYRGKGLLWIAESNKRYVFHLVAKRFSLDEGGREGQTRNKLVLIGRNLDRAQLRSRLEACLTPAPTGLVYRSRVGYIGAE